MNLVFLTHPYLLDSQSMPRFAGLLAEGMRSRGHKVDIWSPVPKAYHLPSPASLKKWLGYVDQYLLFPAEVSVKLRRYTKDTLFVFTDHALGPWVPLVKDHPHVIHCHDFLAQRSALGEIRENPTSWTGKQYQAYIRRGYRKGKHFISVSDKTRQDLHRFLPAVPAMSEVVYNGLNQFFEAMDQEEARKRIGERTKLHLHKGYILHVGGNQWYKNRKGVIDIYDAWRNTFELNLPLIMVGTAPNATLRQRWEFSPCKADIHFLSGLLDEEVRCAYAGAVVLLYPSLEEGFGWPIAEAMASACPVITTEEAPMTEVGGEAAMYIPRKAATRSPHTWAKEAAEVLQNVLAMPRDERHKVIKAGLAQVRKFDTDVALDHIEKLYISILQNRLHTQDMKVSGPERI